jgi:hypothetical protein
MIRLKIPLGFALATVMYCSSASSMARAEPFFAITLQKKLATYDADEPGSLLEAENALTVSPEELIAAIEYVASPQQLYALGTLNRLHKLNPDTGRWEPFGGSGLMLEGTNFGLAFDPTNNVLRVVSTGGQNLRVNPNTGSIIAVDGPFTYAAGDPSFGTEPNLMSAAYGSTAQSGTSLFGIDSRLDVLTFEDPPHSGRLHTVGALGIDVGEVGGFSVSPHTGVAYAALLPSNSSNSFLYTIDLATGAATEVGEIGGGVSITAMTVPEPGTMSLALCSALALVVRFAAWRAHPAR